MDENGLGEEQEFSLIDSIMFWLALALIAAGCVGAVIAFSRYLVEIAK